MTPATTPYVTRFASLLDHQKGGVQVIDDDPRNYVFSNVFDVAATSRPYERVAVAKNLEYVIEAARIEGSSPWYACAHDEFALCMDGEVEIRLVKLQDPEAAAPADSQGAHLLDREPQGRAMGRIVLGRGHMALLPRGAAYRFDAVKPGAMMIQTIEGPVTVQKWSEICQTA